MTVKVDKKKAESLIRRAVRDRGADTVGKAPTEYGCTYRNQGKPVCIVGQVMTYVSDLPLSRIFPGDDNRKGINELWSDVESRTQVEFTPGAKSLLEKAQDKQDSEYTWGEVVKQVLPTR